MIKERFKIISMKKIILAVASVLIIPVLALGVGLVGDQTVAAVGLKDAVSSTGNADGIAKNANLTDGSLVTTIIDFLLWLVVIISVIMLIVGGIKYATSAGDSNKVTSAKNTIIYAILGLVVAIFAWAIISWVTSTFGS